MMPKFLLCKCDYKEKEEIWKGLKKNTQEEICKLLVELTVRLFNEEMEIKREVKEKDAKRKK